MNRAEIIHENFSKLVLNKDLPKARSNLTPASVKLSDAEVVDLFESQVMSRQLDLVSRRLSARGESYYTIGSSGHEGNAVLGKVFLKTDMAFLHYRSGALLIQRGKQLEGETTLYDMLLSFAASSDDPISGGRHKVLGSKSLMVPPQTSTIASHLPKAMGAAFSIGLASKLKFKDRVMPQNSVVICNFGDASTNHSTLLGAINAACWTAYQGSQMPIVFICEDNGIGISTRTPPGWIEANFKSRAGLKYISCDGLDLLDAQSGAMAAEKYVRKYKRPVFLHMRTVRLAGHAGSDIETVYSTKRQIEEVEAQDPLLHTARILVENNILSSQAIVDLYLGLERKVERIAAKAIKRPKVKNAKAVMATIAPKLGRVIAQPLASQADREILFEREAHRINTPQSMIKLISHSLADIMLQYPNTTVMGEDVGQKGGVYGGSQGLAQKFGPARVLNTLLDEQSILGLAIGQAHNGFLPIPEIQFLAYVHNAEDQIRGEAATLPFFSEGQFTNPMVIRIAGLAYQKGFGGHFHNDNSFNVFRDIPGVIVACPSNGRDASKMLRECVRMAHEEKRVVIFIEPIALYMTRDLHHEGDGEWMSTYEPPGAGEEISFGNIGIDGGGKDLTILTYANGYYLSLKAKKILKEKHKVNVRVVDLRWLCPLNKDAIIKAVKPSKFILIVDECRRTGSVGEEIVTLLVEHGIDKPIERVTAEDSFIPLAAAANLVLPSVESIIEGAMSLIKKGVKK